MGSQLPTSSDLEAATLRGDVPAEEQRRPPRRIRDLHPEIGDQVADRYRLDAMIGAGAVSWVFRATDLADGSSVAVKVVREELGQSRGVQLMLAEFDAAARLDLPSVAQVRDLVVTQGACVLSMELADHCLRRELEDGYAWKRGWADKVRDAAQIAEGVAGIHRRGFVHRDLKPANILRMRDGRLLIADLGLAVPQTHAAPKRAEGTPSYMAPEVWNTTPTDRSDVWAMGLIFGELLFGLSPSVALMPRMVPLPGHRSRLRRLLARCCALDPQRRPAAAEVLRMLQRPVPTVSDLVLGAIGKLCLSIVFVYWACVATVLCSRSVASFARSRSPQSFSLSDDARPIRPR